MRIKKKVVKEEEQPEEDEFLKFYRQYRPANRSHSDMDTRSEWSASTTTTNRSEFTGPIFYGSNRRDTMPGSRTVMNGSAYPGSRGHKQLTLRSKSFGRDPRFIDLQNNYKRLDQDFSSQSSNPSSSQGYQSDSRYGAEDSLSRDSGHSSAGTPELARRGMYRINSCPSPNEPSNGIYSNYLAKDRTMNVYGGGGGVDDTQSVYSYTSLQPNHIRTQNPSYRNLQNSKDWEDDTLSLGSWEHHIQNWNRQIFNPREAKRKFDSFSEEEDCLSPSDSSLLEPQQPPSKRPRTPTRMENVRERETKVGMCSQMMRVVCKLTGLLCALIFILVSFIFVYELVKEHQCYQHRALNIDLEALHNKINTSLFGQAIVESEVVTAIREFSNQQQLSAHRSNKPLLVMILIGWTGTGKTHTSNLVASSFPVPSNIHRLAGAGLHTNPVIQDLSQLIQKSCGYSLVIADDVPDNPAVISQLENLILALHSDEESKGNGTLVIVSSSAGGHLINKLVLDKVQSHSPSSVNSGGISSILASLDGDTVRKYLEQQNLQIPLQSFLKVYSIPHLVVPFFPLTRESLRACILAELRESGSTLSSVEIANIMKQVPFFSQQFPVFSKTGCKKVAAKVMLALRLQENNFEL